MSSTEQTFTKQRLSFQEYLSLIGASPKTYCQITQPKECDQPNLHPEREKACTQIFRDCMQFAELFEHWHRSN